MKNNNNQQQDQRQAVATIKSTDNNHTLAVFETKPFVEYDGKALEIVLGRGKSLETKDSEGERMTATTYDGLCYVNNKTLTDGKTIRFNYTDNKEKDAIEDALKKHYTDISGKEYKVVFDYPTQRQARSTRGAGVVLYDTLEKFIECDKASEHITSETRSTLEDYEIFYTYDLCTARAKKDIEDAKRVIEIAESTLTRLEERKKTLDAMGEDAFKKTLEEAREKQNAYTKEAFPDKFKTTKQKLAEENEGLKRQLEEMKKALEAMQASNK